MRALQYSDQRIRNSNIRYRVQQANAKGTYKLKKSAH